MARSADELPREGFDTQQFIENLSDKFGGANNTIDVIMRNLPKIARQVGAKPPAFHPTHSELNMIKPRPQQNIQIPKTAPIDTKIPPKMDDMPKIPKSLHTPMAKMMPGADTEPGKPISEKDAEAFNKMVEMNSARRASMQRTSTNPWDNIPSPFRYPLQNQQDSVNITQSIEKAIFFKDGLGNEFKILGDRLYVLGWQDANVKVRMVSESTGKEVPTNGRKFQIYGWHLVQRINENESTVSDDIDEIESEMNSDDIEKNVSSPKQKQSKVETCEVEAKNDESGQTVKETVEVSAKKEDDDTKPDTVAEEAKKDSDSKNDENSNTEEKRKTGSIGKIGKRRLI